MSDREQEYMEAPTELLGLPSKDLIDYMALECYSAGLSKAGRTLVGLYQLLIDKEYISTRHDYNRGHLSYYGQLERCEKNALTGTR